MIETQLINETLPRLDENDRGAFEQDINTALEQLTEVTDAWDDDWCDSDTSWFSGVDYQRQRLFTHTGT